MPNLSFSSPPTLTTLSISNLIVQGRGPFNLALNQSECVAISGQSGSGKTLLLRAIGDIEAHQGECKLDQIPSHQLPAPEWRRRVGLLPAKSIWWFDRVCEHFHQRDNGALEALGFSPDTWNWQVSRLSSGEQQRLALLRLLQNSPSILLLDEPTASLDKTNSERVELLIKHYQLQHQCPVLWVTHDLDQARRVAQRHYHIRATGLELASSQSA